MSETTNNELGAGLPQSNPLSRKLTKILDTRLESDKDMVDALKAVSVFFTENNLRTRRNLRGDIERQSLTINKNFTEAFSHVIGELDEISQDVQAMSSCCNDMTDRLKTAKEQTHELMSKTSSLRLEGKKLQLQSEVAEAFLTKFQLKPEEAKVFKNARDGNLTDDFFYILEKVKQIHCDVKVLLRTNQQTAGLEIMEQMALHQESAYERLYRWAQSQCRSLTSDTIDLTPMQQNALKALHDRPVLFMYTLDEYSSARRATLVRGFIDALTRGSSIQTSSSNNPRPIEMHSHDPLRYIGDMLAWLHQACATEREHLEQLLKECTKPYKTEQEKTLGGILEGVCRPFQVRMEQVLVGDPGSLILYKLTNLIKFYHATIQGIVGTQDTALLETMNEMHVLCRKLFFNSLNYSASKLLDKIEIPPIDLGPSNTLTQMLHLLKDILNSQVSSMATEVNMDTKQEDYQLILKALLEPLMQMCAMSASQLQPADMATYMINCLYAMKCTLTVYEFMDQRIEMLSAQIEAHLDTLVNEQAAAILTQGGIGNIYNEIQKHLAQPSSSTGLLCDQPGLDKQGVVSALSRFDSYLSSPDDMIMPQVTCLASAILKEVATTRAYDLVLNAYKTIYNELINPENGYKGNITIKTPDQIKVLLY